MLTRNAFNALLKTLEEPPERVVFIFATTEAHKFPITIVSRCQHFVFRHLSEDALAAHLSAVLHKEGAAFEEGAVRLIARRAAGSVRDGMRANGLRCRASSPVYKFRRTDSAVAHCVNATTGRAAARDFLETDLSGR